MASPRQSKKRKAEGVEGTSTARLRSKKDAAGAEEEEALYIDDATLRATILEVLQARAPGATC